METVILIVHVCVAIALVVLVLLQQGKGADTGASFGSGASQTVFGSRGSASFLGGVTAVLVASFFLTSFALAMIAKQKVDSLSSLGVPAEITEIQQESPALSTDAPMVDDISVDSSDAPMIESVKPPEGGVLKSPPEGDTSNASK